MYDLDHFNHWNELKIKNVISDFDTDSAADFEKTNSAMQIQT